MGKGSKQRPMQVPHDEYGASHERIFGKKIKCERCGKTLGPEGYIHTCSPQATKPKEDV